jgi:hypothetical protein
MAVKLEKKGQVWATFSKHESLEPRIGSVPPIFLAFFYL